MSSKIDPKMEEWLNQPNIEFQNSDNKSTIKTNFVIIDRNWKRLSTYLSLLKNYVVYLRNLIDIERIIQEVIENFQKNKTMLNIRFDMVVGQIVTQTVNGIVYQLKRIDNYNIEIKNVTTPEWYVDKLICQVKNVDGTIVFPVIKTKNNNINIYFADSIGSNYNLFFI